MTTVKINDRELTAASTGRYVVVAMSMSSDQIVRVTDSIASARRKVNKIDSAGLRSAVIIDTTTGGTVS